jgi:hypothetical protein
MKKIIIALLLIFAMLICLPSCNDNTNKDNTLETLNGLTRNFVTNKAYTIEVVVENASGDKITEEYSITYAYGRRSVEYKIEKINAFIVDGDTITAPEEYITVSTGTYDREESANTRYDLPTFTFSDETVKDYGACDGIMTGKIADLEAFMGSTVKSTDATVEVHYNESNIGRITVSYKTESGNTTTITYTIK